MAKPDQQRSALTIVSEVFILAGNVIKFMFIALFALFILAALGGSLDDELARGNVAVIPIHGLITNSGDSFEATTGAEDIIELVDDAEENSDISAILLDVDSPGGTPVATDMIASRIARANKTVVAVIGETGASGAYWISTAADKIYANKMSVTGSIGVTASRLEFGGLLADYNVTYRRLVAGKYKDVGTPLREMTSEEQRMYQKILDDLHEEFISTVATNRGLDKEYVRNLSTGFVYLGLEAKKLGLIDEIGGEKEALDYLSTSLNISAEPVDYEKPKSLFQELAGVTSQAFYSVGRGLGASVEGPKVSFT